MTVHITDSEIKELLIRPSLLFEEIQNLRDTFDRLEDDNDRIYSYLADLEERVDQLMYPEEGQHATRL